MAAKRNKSQAKRHSGGGSQPLPGWAWLVLGLVLGIGAFLLAPKFLGGGEGFFRPQPNADAQPPALDANARDNEPIVNEQTVEDAEGNDAGKDSNKDSNKDPQAEEPDYAFYNLLSGEEKPISDAELAAKTRAEEQRAAQAAREAEAAAKRDAAEDAADARDRDTNVAKNSESDGSERTNRDIVEASKPPPAIDNDPPASPRQIASAEPAKADTRYLLQAGAFAASGDAEALKAKIAFLGLSARVESAQIKGNTVYRVRMGPYGSATELAEAKRKLSGGGLPAMAVKVK